MQTLWRTALQSLATLAVGVVLFVLIWLTVWVLRRWFPGIAAKESEIAGSVVAIVGIVVAGIYIPNKVSDDNNARQSRAPCFASVLSLRRSINTVEQGYSLAPLERDQRLADWGSLKTELENTSFGCHDVRLGPPRPTWTCSAFEMISTRQDSLGA